MKHSAECNESHPWRQNGFIFHTTLSRNTQWHLRVSDLRNFLSFTEAFLIPFFFFLKSLSLPPCLSCSLFCLNNVHIQTHKPGHWFDQFRVYRGKREHSWRSLYNWSLEGFRCRTCTLLFLRLSLSFSTSYAHSLCLSAPLFPLAEYAFSGLEWKQRKKGKGRILWFWVCECGISTVESVQKKGGKKSILSLEKVSWLTWQ